MLFSSFLLISTHAQQSWLDKATLDRFRFPQCAENRTWQQLVSAYSRGSIISGGLGPLSSEAFGVWACFAYHPCLSFVPHAQGDKMCYVFHEAENSWYPWCLNTEMAFCSDAATLSETQKKLGGKQKISSVWSSTLRGYQDTGYMPTAENLAHTIIVALRFPSTEELLPNARIEARYPVEDFYLTHDRQWILAYGQLGTGSQHWIWHATNNFDLASTMHNGLTWQLGKWNGNPEAGDRCIHQLNMGPNGEQIQGGKLLTLSAVSKSDGQYMFYVNGRSPQTYRVYSPVAETSTPSVDFRYTSSMIAVGTANSNSEVDFKGTIHETRLYNFSLTAEQVQEVTKELYALYG